MVRYGVIPISKEMVMELLDFRRYMGKRKAIRLITDVPDDLEIIDAGWDETRQLVLLYVRGSGSPLYKVVEGGTIPNISFEWEEIKV